MNFACMDFIGMQNSEKTFAKLMSWFGSQGLLRNSNFELATIFYDSLKIIAPNEVRMSASIILDNLIKSDNTVSAVSFPKGDYLIGHFEIGLEEFEQCWTLMFEQMNSGGSKKTDQPVFQLHHNNFKEHPEKKCFVVFYLPIKL